MLLKKNKLPVVTDMGECLNMSQERLEVSVSVKRGTVKNRQLVRYK
jgi:hypothetical protein